MNTLKKLGLCTAAAVMLSGAPSLAATVVFDDFNGPNQTAVDVAYPGSTSSNSVSFGAGERTLTADNVTNNGVETAATQLSVTEGKLAFSNNEGATGSGTLSYSNVGDIATVANPFFLFDVGFFDGVANFIATVTDTNGGTSTFSELLQPGFSPKLFFSQFTGTADFNMVDVLSFSIDTTGLREGVDGSLDSISISAVPLPAGGLLLVAGLGGLAALRRKKSA